MKKIATLVLALVLLAAGVGLIGATVAASRAFGNSLIVDGATRQAALETTQAALPASGWESARLTLYAHSYLFLAGGLILALLGIWLYARFNRQSAASQKVVKALLTDYRPILILLLVTAVFSCLHARFFTLGNFTNILKQVSHYAVLAAGVYFAILLGGIDISVGSVLAFSGAMAAFIIQSMPDNPWSALWAVLAALVIGAASGVMNGFFIARCGLQPMIVTLAAMSIFRGATLVLTSGAAIPLSKKLAGASSFIAFGQQSVLDGYLPVPIILMAVVYAVVYYFLNQTSFGRHMYAIGGNEEASLLSGIHVVRTKILAYTASGLLAGVAGIIVTARVASATPTAGEGYEMDAIAAVVIGGTSLRGGEGKVLYTLIGALIIGMLNNILNLTNVSAYYQTIVKGIVILLAVLLDARSAGKK